MGDLIRLLALDGRLLDVGVLVALAWLIVKQQSMRSENAAAHAAITGNVEAGKQDVRDVEQRLAAEIAAVKQDVRDVEQRLATEIDGVKEDVRDVKEDVRVLTSHLLGTRESSPDA